MRESEGGWIIVVFVLVLACVYLSFYFYGAGFENGNICGYKHGQIDVLNGIVKYELKIHPDQTKSWKLIETKE